MEALFLNLFNMSITASWLVLAVVLLRIILKKAPKALTVCLWALVAIRLIFPFSIESVLSLIPSTETVPQNIVYSPVPVIDSGIEAFNSAVNPIISRSLAPNPGDSVNPLQVITAISAYIWLVGLFAMLLYSLVSYLYLRNKVKISLNYQNNIYFCDSIDTPFILGMLRPRIYLPSGMNESDIDYVLRHERAHLKRKDHFWKPLAFTLLSVYWFNPVLWIGYILLCRDIELACDEKVIKDFDLRDKKGYSEALISCSVHRRTIMACPLAFGEVGVKGRIKSVLNYKKPAFWIILTAVVASIVLGVCFLTDPVNGDNNDETLMNFLDEVIYDHYASNKSYTFYQSMDYEILGKEKNGDNITVYMWVLYHEYSYDKELKLESGSHIVTAVTAKNVNDYYELVEYWEPRDGAYYDDDIKAKLPLSARLKVFNSQIYYKRQLPKVEQKALNFFISEINTTEYTASLTDGSALIYDSPTKRGAVPVINTVSSFSNSEMQEFHSLLEKQSWKNYNASDKTDYYFNGCIGYDRPIFFGISQKVIFYGAYYCIADEDVFKMISDLMKSATPFFGFQSSTECITIGQLKKKRPEYFEFDPEKGLSVYVWQMAINSYSCAIYEGKHTTVKSTEFIGGKSVSVREARLVLSYYGLDESEISIRPIAVPHSSYFYEKTEGYIDRIRRMLLYPLEKITITPERIIDKAEYDIDDDGILEDCYITNGYTSGVFTFYIEILEQGSEHVFEYYQIFYSYHGKLSFTTKNDRLAVNLNPHNSDDNLIYYVKTSVSRTVSLEADENNVKDKYGSKPIYAPIYLTNEGTEEKRLTALKIRVPEYFNISDLKGIEIYTWQTDNGNAYGILPCTNRLKNYDEIKSMKPVSYDELTLILSTYGLSEAEIKNMTAIKITISDGEYSFGFTSDSLETLKKQFPQYFGLSTAKGLEVYVWQTGEFEYYCGLLPGRDLNYTNAVLQALKPASLAEMKTIIAIYGLPRKEVTVIPLIKHSSNYKYTIDSDYANKIQELFWDYAETSFNYPSPDFDEWGITMDVNFKNGSDFEIILTNAAGLATRKGKLTTGPDYEIKAVHDGNILPYGKFIRDVKGFGYEDKILAWDTVLYTVPENGVLKIEGTTKLFDDTFPEGEYVICKTVTLEDENGNRTTREYTYVFYAYG